MYLLTTCASCAAPIPLSAPKCVRCKTRYCNSTCQQDHWRRGHKQICKKIHRGGNAEQHHAENKYKEAVAVAAEACADDTKGQTCYICTVALHWKTKEGLVRGCACRGAAGFAHVSCLAEQAKILMDEAEETNWVAERATARWRRWEKCSLCEQNYHGVVACALGWACWKTYVGRPEDDVIKRMAMTQLGTGLHNAEHYEDARAIFLAAIDSGRTSSNPVIILDLLRGLATINRALDRRDEELDNLREFYAKTEVAYGRRNEQTYAAAFRLGEVLLEQYYVREALQFLRETGKDLGKDHPLAIEHAHIYWRCF